MYPVRPRAIACHVPAVAVLPSPRTATVPREWPLLATPTCQLRLSWGFPASSRDSRPFTPLGKCPAPVFLTLAPHQSVFFGRFSAGDTPTNPQLRNC